MKKRKILYSMAISVLALGIITSVGNVVIKNVIPHTEYHEAMYTSEVLKPEFLAKNSDVIIVGKVIGKSAPAKANAAGGRKDEVVYTDTSVKVEKVVRDKTKAALAI